MNILPVNKVENARFGYEGDMNQCMSVYDFRIAQGILGELLNKYYDEEINTNRFTDRLKFDNNWWNYYRKDALKQLLDELPARDDSERDPKFFIEFTHVMERMLENAEEYEYILFEGP